VRHSGKLSVFGIVLFIYILLQVDVEGAFTLIFSANRTYLAFGIVLVFAEMFLRARCWHLLGRIFRPDYSYTDAFKAYMMGIAFGAVTPGRAGDFIKVGSLTKVGGIPLSKAFTVGLLDRLLNLIFLGMCAAIASFIVLLSISGFESGIASLLAALTALMAVTLVGLNQDMMAKVLKPLKDLILPERLKKRASTVFRQFYGSMALFRKSSMRWHVILYTMMGWMIIFIRPYFFGRSIGMDAGITAYLVFMPIISLAEALPISVFGLGTRDATVLSLFSLMDFTRDQMMALSLMLLTLSYLPQAALGYVISLLSKKPG
jgi:glycosyltransferase 2 family protein